LQKYGVINKMLDWGKIDNDKTFQRLVSQLVSLECRTPGFLPSSPYIGPDGGYDAYVKEYYEENLSGDTCIQAKYTKHSGKQAYNTLRAEVKKELKKAEINKISHLILVTNAELNIDYIKKLTALNSNSDLSLFIWDREKLIIKIERQPFLRSYYFDCPSIPLFIPSTVYYEEVEKSLIENVLPIEEIGTINSKLNEFELFLKDNRRKIFLIHAPGGYGKSHFLREISKLIFNKNIDREVWFIRDGIRDIKEAFGDEIGVRETATEKHKYVFIVDDADRADDIKDTLLCISKSGIDAKLVMSFRTSGKSAIENTLVSAKCLSISTMVSIPGWTREEYKKLLRAVSHKDSIQDEDDIVRRYPNPFFLVKIGLNIKGHKDYDFAITRKAILESLLHDAKQVLSDYSIDVEELLLNLTLIVPINITANTTLTKLASNFDIDETQLKKILDKLVAGGVLRSIGNILRFIPDMIGDVFLSEKMLSSNKTYRKQIFLYWFDTHSKNVFCNLGATLMYGESAYLLPIVEDIISSWIANAGKYSNYEKQDILEKFADVCGIAPERTVDLLWTFIKYKDLSTDAYGPIIIRLIHSSCPRNEIIKLIEGVRKNIKLGTYDNYKPNSLVRDTVSPLQNNIDAQIIPILNIIAKETKKKDGIIEFAKVALGEVLSSAHEWTHSSYNTVTFGNRALEVTDAVLKMRNKAITILKAMLLDNQPIIRLNAIEVIENIGKSYFGPGQTEIPLKDKISIEREELLDFINENNLIDTEKDWSVLSSYEDLLFIWWAQREVSDEKIVPMLYKFKYDAEYRINRFYISRWDISENIQDKIKDAPLEDRWKWTVDNLMHRKWHMTIDDFDDDAKVLCKKYPEAHHIVEFLCDLDQRVKIESTNVLFLKSWFKQAPEEFKNIRLTPDLWAKTPLVFKYTITYNLVQKYPELAKVIIDEILLAPSLSINEAKIAIGILTCGIPSINKYEIIKFLAEKNIDELNLIILERIQFMSGETSPEEMGKVVLIVLAHLTPEVQSISIEQILYILHKKGELYRKVFLDIIRDAVYKILINSKKLGYHDSEMAFMIFKDIKTLLEFIEARLEKEKYIKRYSEYRAIPFRGINALEKEIKNDEDYFYLIQKIIEWDAKYEDLMSFSIKTIFEQVISLKNISGISYFDIIKNKFYKKTKFPNFLRCLYHVKLNLSTIDTFYEAIEKSNEFGFDSNMGELLKSKIYPEDVWSSSLGEVPPAFIERKKVFQNLKDKSQPGVIKEALYMCIQGVENMIKEHKKEEENRFHSR